MRNQALTGYLLHHRAYQDKRTIYYLFSEEYGVVHGVGKKGIPLFAKLQLFATGKRELKNFSHIDLQTNFQQANIQQTQPIINILGQQQYSALYLNEILWRLLPIEEAVPTLWTHYQNTLVNLSQPLSPITLRVCLREFEQHLFTVLGFETSLIADAYQQPIDPKKHYHFYPDNGGWVTADALSNIESSNHHLFLGADLYNMQANGINERTLPLWSQLHRQLIDYLLDYAPLQSRLLWQQQQSYKNL